MYVCPLYTSGHGYTVGSCPAERDLTMMPSPELKQLPLNMTTTMNDDASFIDSLRQRLSLPNPYPPLFRQICCSRLEQGGCELSQSEATHTHRNALLSLFVAVACCFLSFPPKSSLIIGGERRIILEGKRVGSPWQPNSAAGAAVLKNAMEEKKRDWRRKAT